MPQYPNSMGPYQSLEELQRQAYQQPQRVKTTRLNPNVDYDQTNIEEESIIQPGWQKSAAVDALKRVQGVQYANEDADRARIEQIRGAQQESKLSGFDTPQAQGQYERRIGEEKMRQPVVQQGMIGDQQRDVTRMQGANQINTEKLRQSGFESNYNELANMIQAAQLKGSSISDIRLPSRTGGGGFKIDTNPVAATQFNGDLLDRVREARGALAAQRSPVSESNYDAAVSNVLLDAMRKKIISHPTVIAAQTIAKNPALRDLPWEMLQQHLEAEGPGGPDGPGVPLDLTNPVTQREQEELYQALMMLRQ